MNLAPYLTPADHLRDELRRVWLSVEYATRLRWELSTLPRVSDDAGTGLWEPDNLAGLFRAAQGHAPSLPPEAPDGGSAALREAFLRLSDQIEGRVAATLAAGLRLPLIDLVRSFQLSRPQQAALTYALAAELDPDLLTAYRYLTHDPTCRGLDARLLAMLVYDSAESRATLSLDLSPDSPLCRYRLLEIDDPGSHREAMLYQRLRPAARLVQMITGAKLRLDPQLGEVATLLDVDAPPPPGLFPAPLLAQAAAALAATDVLLVLQGIRGTGKKHLLRCAAQQSGRRLLLLDGHRLAGLHPEALAPLLRALLREARLLQAVPVIPDLDDVMLRREERDEPPDFVRALCQGHDGAVALTVTGDRLPRLSQRPVVHLGVELPSRETRAALWRSQVPALPGADADTLAARFAIPGGVITLAARAAAAGTSIASAQTMDAAVRGQLHDRLCRLGRRLPTPYALDDLVVDNDLWDTLGEIIACVRDHRKVREDWGFRGAQGVSVLFSGDPGVGKTMSATVLARQLGLAIYEIDLARVVSKWLGETEKNLSEVFDAAEPGHVVLLFNEADSLFGKRTTDVKTANDRYANLETNYLLQRLERFSGLSILTTNLGKAIDPAFRRRFAYDVQFTFPSADLRAELWQRAIPPRAEIEEVDFQVLAERFSLSGGFIKVAAERAAFQAAARGQPISGALIVDTVERMYRERGKLSAFGQLE